MSAILEIQNAAADTFVPPYSLEAEQSVLGSLLVDPSNFNGVASLVTEESFFVGSHRAIWSAIQAKCNAGQACDPLTVFAALQEAGAETGGLPYLTQLASSVFGASPVRHAGIVRERHLQRQIIGAAYKAIEIAREPGAVAEKLDRISGAFQGIERTQMRKVPRHISELVIRAIDRYNDMADGKAPKAWPTGIQPLDRLLNGGIRPGKLYGVAARPSVGKSSAARSMAATLAAAGVTTLILSQEMPVDEVADCLVAQEGNLSGARIASGEFEQEDWSRVVDAAEALRPMSLYVDDDGGLTINQIAAKCRDVKGLKVLVLDYLQLSQSTNTKATTNDQIAEISKGLKRLALNLDIAVIVLSQLNRDVEKRADKEPVLADLRDSGAIEQDLDVAILLWTAQMHEDSRLVGWKVAKHRGGRIGTFGMRFTPSVYRWHESAEDLRAPPVAFKRKGDGL
jgi:replicative DNA helicase